MDPELNDIAEFVSDFDHGDSEPEHSDDTIYKRWHRKGFISIRPWLDAGRFVVDIGAINADTKAKISNTVAYVKAIDLATYLRSVTNNNAVDLYPAGGVGGNVQDNVTPESFVVYGGSHTKDHGPTSRIFKIHHWGIYDKATKTTSYDPTAFAWKIGLFKAGTTSSGAFIAKRDQILQADMIKIPRQEMHRIEYCVNLALVNYAATHPTSSLNPG